MIDMCYDDLPDNYKAIREIRKAPFYGRDNQDLVIRYIYSHALWYVGSNRGFSELRGRCAKEAVELCERLEKSNDSAFLRRETRRAIFG